MATTSPAGVGLLHVVLPVADLVGVTVAIISDKPANADRFSRLALAVASRKAIAQAEQLVVAEGLAVVVPPSRLPMHDEHAWGLELSDVDGNRLTVVHLGVRNPEGGRRDRFADSGHGELPDYPNP